METGGVGASVAGGPGAIRAEVAELLGVSADTVDPDGNLVSQGLDSIRMMSLAGRWRRRGIAVDFATLAATPTIEAWSLLVSGAQADTSEPVDAEAVAATGTPDDAFPLAPMQHAMWVGRHDNQPLGGVAGHLYVEFDGNAIDPDRLREAATNLATRHPMLRVQFLSDGTQRIDPAAERTGFPVTVHDLRDLAEDVVEQRLTVLREAKSHQQLDGQVLELTLSLLPGGRSRLHVDLDMQAADAMSYRTLMADLAALYQGRQLPALRYTYREYRQEMARRESGPQREREADRDWWAQRIPELPDPPGLPSATRKHLAQQHPPLAVARSPDSGCAVHQRPLPRCHPRDDVRRSVRPHAGALVEHFAIPVERAAIWPRGRASRRGQPGRRLHVVAAARHRPDGQHHSSVAGPGGARGHGGAPAAHSAATPSPCRAPRDLARYRGTPVLAPVVFTSALGLGELFCADVTRKHSARLAGSSRKARRFRSTHRSPNSTVAFWRTGTCARTSSRPVSSTPCALYHIDELLRLAAADDWDAPDPPALPATQRAVRDAANSRSAAPSGEALHDGFFRRRRRQQPDAPAVFSAPVISPTRSCATRR